MTNERYDAHTARTDEYMRRLKEQEAVTTAQMNMHQAVVATTKRVPPVFTVTGYLMMLEKLKDNVNRDMLPHILGQMALNGDEEAQVFAIMHADTPMAEIVLLQTDKSALVASLAQIRVRVEQDGAE